MNITTASNIVFNQEKIIADLASLLPQSDSCWLVGGAIRDALMGRPINDFDFATAFDPTRLAKAIANKRDGHFFYLDKERLQCRVVLRSSGTSIDFAPLRAETIEGDLAKRDFTINAMAFPVAKLTDDSIADLPAPVLLDPLGGFADIERGIIRHAFEDTFVDDPLRIIKGIRHAAVLGFALDTATLQLMKQQIQLLDAVARERIGSEWQMIINTEASTDSLVEALQQLIHIDFWQLFLPAGEVENVAKGLMGDEGLAQTTERISEYIEQITGPKADATNSAAITTRTDNTDDQMSFRYGVLFRHCDKDSIQKLLFESFRLSRSIVTQVVALCIVAQQRPHLPSGQPEAITSRGEALWVAQLPGKPIVTLNYLACIYPEQYPVERIETLITSYSSHLHHGRIPDLVTADRVVELTGKGGKALGELLKSIRKKEISGDILSVAEAEKYLIEM